MNMFDDLDHGFEPSTDAALPAVTARVKQMRTRRRVTAVGVIAAVIVVGLATVAFALPRGSRNAQVEIQPPTTTTSTPADQAVNADKVHRSGRTATTSTTVAKSSSASAAATLPRNPTYRAQLVPAVHDAEDYSALEVSVAPTFVTALQGNTATTTVTVHNAGSWSVTPPRPTCEVVEPNMTPPCNGRALDTTPLAPGATRTYPVTIYAVHTPASGPQVAVDPGDYTVPVLYLHTYPVTLHVTNALTAHVSLSSPTVHAGDPLSITLSVTNASNTWARYTYLPTACGLSLVPSSEVCAQRTQYVMVPARDTSSVTLPVNTDGAKPGTYHLEVGDQTLTVTVSK